MTTFGERVKRERERQKMSRKRLSTLSGVSRSSLLRLEEEENASVNLESAVAIARVLRLPLDYLAGTFEDHDVDELAAASA